MARRTQDGEGRHVGTEEREEKDKRSERTAGQKEVFSLFFAGGFPKREDTDVENNAEINENEDRGNQVAESPLGFCCSISLSKCPGQANFTSAHISRAANTEKQP